MTIPRSVWISIAAVSAIIVVAGTVWWLRTRSIEGLAPLNPSEKVGGTETSTDASASTSSASTAAAIEASNEIFNRPVFFAPEPQVSPGINIMYPSDGVTFQVTDETLAQNAAPPLGAAAPAETVTAPPVDPGETDPDQDGLNNNQEGQLGTDSTKKDTDGDTLSDGDEVKKYRTDPLRADSDGDGYTDAEEIKNGYNPLGSGKCLTSDCAF